LLLLGSGLSRGEGLRASGLFDEDLSIGFIFYLLTTSIVFKLKYFEIDGILGGKTMEIMSFKDKKYYYHR